MQWGGTSFMPSTVIHLPRVERRSFQATLFFHPRQPRSSPTLLRARRVMQRASPTRLLCTPRHAGIVSNSPSSNSRHAGVVTKSPLVHAASCRDCFRMPFVHASSFGDHFSRASVHAASIGWSLFTRFRCFSRQRTAVDHMTAFSLDANF